MIPLISRILSRWFKPKVDSYLPSNIPNALNGLDKIYAIANDQQTVAWTICLSGETAKAVSRVVETMPKLPGRGWAVAQKVLVSPTTLTDGSIHFEYALLVMVNQDGRLHYEGDSRLKWITEQEPPNYKETHSEPDDLGLSAEA